MEDGYENEISPFPIFPFLFLPGSLLQPHILQDLCSFPLLRCSGGHPPGLRAVLLPKVPGELHFLLHCAKLLPFNHLASWLALCVGVCFSCFLTCILFGGVGISLSRWSPSQDILQSICEPETTGDFFFLLTQEGPSVCFMLPILLVNLKACSFCKTTL